MKTEDNDIPKSHDGPRRGIGILLVILTLCCVSFVSILLGPSLLDRASVVLEFESQHLWMPRKLNDGVPVIATLSDTTWLVGQLDTNGNLVMQYKMERLEFNPSRRFANAQLASVLNQNGTLVGDMEPSPDGRWVLGTLFADPTPWSPAWRVATSIDGSHITRWSANLPKYSYAPVLRSVNGSYIAWMPDSRNVAEIVADKSPSGTLRLQGTLHDVYSGRTSTLRFSAPDMPERGAQLAIRPGVLLLNSVSNYDQALTSPVRRLFRDSEKETVKPIAVDLYAWPLLQSDAHPQISHLKTPSGTWLVGLAFSPDGKRIAWEVVREFPPSTLVCLLCHLLRRPVPTPAAQIEVWTSGIDGSRMEIIGSLPPTDYWNKENVGMELHLAWLPGGKVIRFAFKDKIFTVKADQE